MQIPIDEIKIRKRIRKDLGNIPALAESLKKYGQLSPVIISKTNVLIAGERRLNAAKSLGWKTINAVTIDAPGKLAKLELEVEENIQRHAFTPIEEAEASNKLYNLRNPGFFRRIINAIINFFKKLFRIED
ncbi:MAG: ParB/RepB/Spo0J family partition protein [Treponema sp.]|nr:ParB/RepB/Spo0J family partition protein [Treponema sp.]